MRFFREPNKLLRFAQFGLIVLVLTSVSNASTVVYDPDALGAGDSVFAITGFVTDGAAMAALGGFNIRVHFSDGSDSGLVAWSGGCGAGCGLASGAAGSGAWTLTETGDTGAISTFPPDTHGVHAWTLTDSSTTAGKDIVSVELLGGARIAFDRDRKTSTSTATGGDEGTPGSSFGIDYVFASEAGGTFTVNAGYQNIVQLTPSQPCNDPGFAGNTTVPGCGDLWNNLVFTFTVGTFRNNGSGNAVWAFFQDTDTVGVPEPATLALIGAGLLGLGAYRRRRRISR